VLDVLVPEVLTQDYRIQLGASFVEKMHEGVSNSRDLILFTHDYLQSPSTRKEFTSFEAQRLRSLEHRHIVVLRCDDAPLVGLLSDNVYQTLVGIVDAAERKRRIIAAAVQPNKVSAYVVPRPSKKATVFEIQSTVACNWTDPRFQIRLSGIGPTADVKWSRSITVYGCPAPDHQPRSSSPQAGGAEWLKDARGSPEVVGARTASPRMGLAIRYGQVAVRASAQGQSSCEL
jgi:hypothetical protein